MKNNFIILLSIAIISFSSCSEKDGEDGSGTLTMQYEAKVNNSGVQLNQFYDLDGDSVIFEVLKFYVSEVAVEDKDGTAAIEIKEVALVDFSDATTTSFSKELAAGAYKTPSYLIGLSDELNASDPSSFSAENPLSLNQSNYWMMANSYIYFKIEGFRRAGGSDFPFVYHVGLDGMSKAKEVTKGFSINDGNVTTVISTLDLNAVFDNIDFTTESETHTTNNKPLADKMMANFANSMTVN